MSTRRAASKKVILPPGSEEERLMKQARKLPMFGPGLVIPVPLSLYPAYMDLYGLEPVRWEDGKQIVRRTALGQTETHDADL